MIRDLIVIDEDKCNGCSLCVDACHEGALQMVNGKAKLISESYCDGLGDCLPECPTGAITIEKRETVAYDEEAVAINMAKAAAKKKAAASGVGCNSGGCPGSMARSMTPAAALKPVFQAQKVESESVPSQLQQWPVQIKLVPVNAPYFENAELLVAADCTAFAYGNFHKEFIKNKITMIGCPKLDEGDYADKLTAILSSNEIKSLTVVRMQVPCCGGIVNAVKQAIKNSGVVIPWNIVTISVDGKIVS